MGLDAELIAVGKFRPELAKHLEYPESAYDDVVTGNVINTSIFQMTTTLGSEELAEALGISARDLNTHFIVPATVNRQKLSNFCEDYGLMSSFHDFCALDDAGFCFIYRPNG